MKHALWVKFVAVVGVVLAITGCSSSPKSPAFGSKTAIRVALLADPHVNLATNGNNASFRARFEKAITQVNAAGADLVLIAGDLTQSGKPEEFARFKQEIRKFRAPVCFVPGNHDIGNKFGAGEAGSLVSARRIEAYEAALGPTWFAKTVAGVRVIGLNSSLLGSALEAEQRMWSFLEGELAQPGRKPAIALMHYPLFVKDLGEPGGGYFNTEPVARARLLGLLQQGGVKTVLSGHVHSRIVNRDAGMLFVTAPPISFGLPAGVTAEGWSLITLPANGEAEETIQKLD
jgi:3',5'-cyclic AMP phosphodiesterase CpdA